MTQEFPTLKCPACGVLMFVARTREGKKRPLTAQQVVNGNVQLINGRAIAGPPGFGPYEFHLNSCRKKPRI